MRRWITNYHRGPTTRKLLVLSGAASHNKYEAEATHCEGAENGGETYCGRLTLANGCIHHCNRDEGRSIDIYIDRLDGVS